MHDHEHGQGDRGDEQLFAVSGRQHRRNPNGRDGQPLKCHICGPTQHLQAKCPQQPRRQSHNGVPDYEFRDAVTTTVAISLEQALNRDVRSSLGIIAHWNSGPTIQEVTEESLTN